MTSTLRELCKHIEKCTERLDEEIKRNIDDCHKLLLSNEATEVKLALEKAKDYHYKEILDFLKQIINNVRKILFHEEKIKALNEEKGLPLDELKRYSHVQRQISIFSNIEDGITKREKRRVASEISIGSLEAWEHYLEKKAEEEKIVQTEKSELQKRKRPNSKRRKKKFVSSTFNNFLDGRGEDRKLDSILEDSVREEDFKDKLTEDFVVVSKDNLALESNVDYNTYTTGSDARNNSLEQLLTDVDKISFGRRTELDHSVDEPGGSAEGDGYSISNIVESINRELCFEDPVDSRPKIVDVVYKKRENKEQGLKKNDL